LPTDIDAYDAFVTTGSKASAYDDEPWIDALIVFVQQLHAQQKKLIGICFGHQIIALALGQRVEKSANGWGIGIATNRVLATPAWMSQSAEHIHILASHQDQVMTIPAQAQVIAESDFCPYFMLQWNDHFLSIQGHPEWNNDYSAALINERRNIIPAKRVNVALHSLRQAPDNALVVRWMMDFILDHDSKQVFVFGTLRKGYPNHALNSATLIDAACSTAQAYPLYLVGARFSPWLIDDPENGVRVQGELYRVTKDELATMDALERVQFSDGYQRRQISIVDSAGITQPADCYLKTRQQLAGADIHMGPLASYQKQHAALYKKRTL